MLPATTARRPLVHRHHIGERHLEETVVLLQKRLQDSRQRFVLLRIKFEQASAVPRRSEMHLVRPARECRHERDPALIAGDGAIARTLTLNHIAVETASGSAPMPGLGPQLSFDGRWHERVSVDLSVRMAQGDADRLASVLEDVDIAHALQPREIERAIAPDLDEVLDVRDGLFAEG